MNEQRLAEIAAAIRLANYDAEEFARETDEQISVMENAVKRKKTANSAVLAKTYAEIGKDLCEAKDICEHGTFKRWITDNCPFSFAAAQRYMTLARHVEETGEVPKMSIIAFVEMKAATDEHKAIIKGIIEKEGYICANRIREIRGRKTTVVKTNYGKSVARINQLTIAIKHSEMNNKELLNIRDEFLEAAEFVAKMIKEKRQHNFV